MYFAFRWVLFSEWPFVNAKLIAKAAISEVILFLEGKCVAKNMYFFSCLIWPAQLDARGK